MKLIIFALLCVAFGVVLGSVYEKETIRIPCTVWKTSTSPGPIWDGRDYICPEGQQEHGAYKPDGTPLDPYRGIRCD